MARARAEAPTAPPGGKLRRLVPRHAWPAAQDALRRAKAAWLAEAVHDRHAVLVSTTAKGAAALERFGAAPANGVHIPKPPGIPKPPKDTTRGDALEQAFARYAAEIRAGTREGIT